MQRTKESFREIRRVFGKTESPAMDEGSVDDTVCNDNDANVDSHPNVIVEVNDCCNDPNVYSDVLLEVNLGRKSSKQR